MIDRRVGAIELFSGLSEAQQELLALDAWSIGLRALRNAHAQAQEARLADVGTALLADVDRQLNAHVEEQQRTIASVLAKYFDPNDGQVSQRLQAFVADEGALAQILERHLGPQNSVLAETLARQVGERSELFRKLSPTESDGLVQVLERQLREVMDKGHGELVKALDPLAEDGAVARFLRSLREELKSADEDRTGQLAKAMAALDANDENSLLSRLVRETARARQALLHAVNPDAPDSPMAALKTTLTAVVNEHAASQQELLKEQRERQHRLIYLCEKGVVEPDVRWTWAAVVSPLIANIFLDAVLDGWFEDVVKPRLRGRALLVHYADDAVLVFGNEDDVRFAHVRIRGSPGRAIAQGDPAEPQS